MPRRRSASLSSINANRLAGFDMLSFLLGTSPQSVEEHQTDAHKRAAACCHTCAHPPDETSAEASGQNPPVPWEKSAQSPAPQAPSTANAPLAPAPWLPSADIGEALYTP